MGGFIFNFIQTMRDRFYYKKFKKVPDEILNNTVGALGRDCRVKSANFQSVVSPLTVEIFNFCFFSNTSTLMWLCDRWLAAD